MKKPALLLSLFAALFIISCKKDSFITGKEAVIQFSSDTLFFDTVFTSTGSVTQALKVINGNDRKLRLSDITLVGGSASYFAININGSPGPSQTGLELEAGDSLYIFVAVTIKPDAANLPFIVADSIGVSFNGNRKYIQLQAWGQNAHFLRNAVITGNTIWDNTLPYVIAGSLQVAAGATLTLTEGCKVYSHADAPILVDGSLRVLGDKYDSTRVRFQGDRLDEPYREYPGSWPGIYFRETSVNNLLRYAIVKNAYQAVVAESPSSNAAVKLVMDQCIIDNAYDAGVLGARSSIRAANCLISNCGKNIVLGYGGSYSFTHCTAASYSNNFIAHTQPVLFLSNYVVQGGAAVSADLDAAFINCIFWGGNGTVDDEVQVSRQGGNNFTVSFSNSLWKVKTAPTGVTASGMIANIDPLFDSVSTFRQTYDLHLKTGSPAIDKGVPTPTTVDLDGNVRPVGLPDLGCYEHPI